jgi:hypothetical protein
MPATGSGEPGSLPLLLRAGHVDFGNASPPRLPGPPFHCPRSWPARVGGIAAATSYGTAKSNTSPPAVRVPEIAWFGTLPSGAATKSSN